MSSTVISGHSEILTLITLNTSHPQLRSRRWRASSGQISLPNFWRVNSRNLGDPFPPGNFRSASSRRLPSVSHRPGFSQASASQGFTAASLKV